MTGSKRTVTRSPSEYGLRSQIPARSESDSQWMTLPDTRSTNTLTVTARGGRHAGNPRGFPCKSPWSRAVSARRITFTPGLWAETDGHCRQSGSKLGGPGSNPDAVLFHELVHVYRHITGSRLEYTLTVDGFPSQRYEEFVAILVTNLYLSEANSTQLRSFNHDVIDAMTDSKNYMHRNGNRELVEELCGSSKIRPFLMELALVPCEFNPLHEVLYPRGDFVDRRAALV